MNIDYVFGLDDAHPQTWMPAGWYLIVWIVALFVIAYLPTHLALLKWTAARNSRNA